MNDLKLFRQINQLFKQHNLEPPVHPLKPVTGGLMHTMYQVRTEHNHYAVKELNSSIMQRSGVIRNIVNSERIAQAFHGIVPAAAAVWFDDNPLLMLEGRYYLIFDWLDGAAVYPPHITPDHCMQMGTLLGKMHSAGIQVPGIQREAGNAERYDWNQHLLSGQALNKEWIDELSQMIRDLASWNQETCAACHELRDNLVLSHRDMDPKNVLWENNRPSIIDWEAAGYVNPYQDLLERLNDWSDQGNGQPDQVKFIAFYHAYTSIAGKCPVNWDMALAAGFAGMLGWLDYSFKRSLGIEAASLEERELGTKQAMATMKALKRYDRQRTLLKNWLEE
ncbi:MAG: phosphotransferase [Clostridiaceae bacterium]|nr:phosphotransferase [Clostridiaceae bacterium]